MSTASTQVAPYRVTFATILRILAMAVGTLAIAQFALAGFGAFDGLHGAHGYGPHKILGYVIGGATVLVLIVTVIARPTSAVILRAAALFIMAGPVQPLLAQAGEDHAWVGVLHALVGLAILGACFGLSLRSTSTFSAPVGRGTPAASGSTTEPPPA